MLNKSIICIFVAGFLCIETRSDISDLECPPTGNDLKIFKECADAIAKDALNVTAHQDEFLKMLRETIRTEKTPPGSVKYYFLSPEKPKEPISITATKESFKKIQYNKKKPLAFGIHGYAPTNNLTSGKVGDLAQALVKLDKYNVIFVDYTALNKGVLSVAVPRAYVAARDMTDFLTFLMHETGTKLEEIHILGISLGGHVSGMIGQYLPGIGRISGLEPGGTFFTYFPKDLRLDRGDANFVDVIHTADEYPIPKGFGFYKPLGHLDFYPNGGLFQPNCGSTIPIDQEPTTVKEIVARNCMHERVIGLYTESITNECLFVGTMCENYKKYEKGLCKGSSKKFAVMGEHASKPSIDLPEDTKFYLDTNDKSPYCKEGQKFQ